MKKIFSFMLVLSLMVCLPLNINAEVNGYQVEKIADGTVEEEKEETTVPEEGNETTNPDTGVSLPVAVLAGIAVVGAGIYLVTSKNNKLMKM